MPRAVKKTARASRATNTKYDAHHQVLTNTYGAQAGLRRELADSKFAIEERSKILDMFAGCADSQRAYLLLDDYFEKLSLSRKDFGAYEWWPKLVAVVGQPRLEELAILFLRANRSLPNELIQHARPERLAEIEEAEQEGELVGELERWLLPPAPTHLDGPRATLRVVCQPVKNAELDSLHAMQVDFVLFRPRSGEKVRTPKEILDLVARASQEQELFSVADWAFCEWFAEAFSQQDVSGDSLVLQGLELLQWLVRWGHENRLELPGNPHPIVFDGTLAELVPVVEAAETELGFTQQLKLPNGKLHGLEQVKFFGGRPMLVLDDNHFYLLRKTPPLRFFNQWLAKPKVAVKRLSHRFLAHLRHSSAGENVDWNKLFLSHPAKPQFVFELADDTVRLRLLAKSERDKSIWFWNGHEWQRETPNAKQNGRPEILDDDRLHPATQWLQRLDWFTPEPGLWIGDANENFLNTLAGIWEYRPEGADYLGNPGFNRLFMSPRALKPQLIVKGSGIDWFSVSAEWEVEGMRLTEADLKRLASSSGKFVKLPDSGWVQLDSGAVQKAHEMMADMGIDGLVPIAQKVSMGQAAHLDEEALAVFGDTAQARKLRDRLKDFKGVPSFELPATIDAQLRPYQKEGFDFLCHLSEIELGGILADDMGLGKTLQTLSWLDWLLSPRRKQHRPALVICPASVLHNWRREANRFTPHLKVLVLESGSARHNLRKQIPEHDIIVTNYALLRRDLEALQKFEFSALVLDEAQFIKNPTAQVTQSVKQLEARHRLALTGTPLENRLLDLWSITDFIQPGYLGTQEHFLQTYDPKGEGEEAISAQRIARRKLSAKLRPLMLRRLKRQVAKDLPERIEQRSDCEMGDVQRKLYLAELRRSREQVMQTVREKGLGRSKLHVLAALTRLRQICCHPTLVGSDAPSGKTDTLFELLEPMLAEGQKVLVFSQFVQMLHLLEKDCGTRSIPTFMLTGETKNRQEIVNQFQQDTRGSVFLLSLRAAGTGLNLTTASYVVLYDPWWNPAVEAQAIDRSHRIGQTRTVNAYKLITPGTVEEKIWDLQQRKAQTIADVLGEEGFAKSLSQTDLEYLFSED
jgi:superfamily II DNA or RNA helicase